LLDLLHEEGPATEGIFRIAASEKARRELREALNSGEEVDLAKQPVHLLAAVLKDFLRNIPSKLLVADLRDKWLLALERPTQDERIVALKDANLLLLRRLLSLLHRVSESAESNKMHARNLAICLGPSVLSCDSDSVLPLDVQQARNDKVCSREHLMWGPTAGAVALWVHGATSGCKLQTCRAAAGGAEMCVWSTKGCSGPLQHLALFSNALCVQVMQLMEFLICHHADLFGEELPLPCTPSNEEDMERTHSSTGKRLHG
uniref:Rho-GAP domain-containing protein n=1 Tax=Nothoprocta perdicaria TaxID=30464 RepID=A0A8C6ZBE9_NOTPE